MRNMGLAIFSSPTYTLSMRYERWEHLSFHLLFAILSDPRCNPHNRGEYKKVEDVEVLE